MLRPPALCAAPALAYEFPVQIEKMSSPYAYFDAFRVVDAEIAGDPPVASPAVDGKEHLLEPFRA